MLEREQLIQQIKNQLGSAEFQHAYKVETIAHGRKYDSLAVIINRTNGLLRRFDTIHEHPEHVVLLSSAEREYDPVAEVFMEIIDKSGKITAVFNSKERPASEEAFENILEAVRLHNDEILE